MSKRQYFTQDGEPCSLDTLCAKEPAWAANRIRAGEEAAEQLEAAKAEIVRIGEELLKAARMLRATQAERDEAKADFNRMFAELDRTTEQLLAVQAERDRLLEQLEFDSRLSAASPSSQPTAQGREDHAECDPRDCMYAVPECLKPEPEQPASNCTCDGKSWNPLRPFAHRDDCPIAGGECRGCGNALLKANRVMADGCPCNSKRGVNHGLVAEEVCTCDVCDPCQTGSSRHRAEQPAEVKAQQDSRDRAQVAEDQTTTPVETVAGNLGNGRAEAPLLGQDGGSVPGAGSAGSGGEVCPECGTAYRSRPHGGDLCTNDWHWEHDAKPEQPARRPPCRCHRGPERAGEPHLESCGAYQWDLRQPLTQPAEVKCAKCGAQRWVARETFLCRHCFSEEAAPPPVPPAEPDKLQGPALVRWLCEAIKQVVDDAPDAKDRLLLLHDHLLGKLEREREREQQAGDAP